MKSLLVYCGSRMGDRPEFEAAARELGAMAAARGWRIVYGGGKLGLMGATASAAHRAGGKVFGVIPDFLVSMEGVLEEVDHVVVKTMHERKMMMFEEADAIVTLPGGVGTLEEIIETMSWARLDLHKKPLIVLNLGGFWEPLRALINHVVDRGFAAEELRTDLIFVDTVDEVFKVAESRALEAVI